jgi:uncharacterized protein (TIGR00255 family)
MIKSMTGYGRSDLQEDNKKIVVEIRGVNHRYNDFNIRVARCYSFLEDYLREYLQKHIHRGKISVSLNIDSTGEEDKLIMLNKSLAKSYINSLYQLRDEYGLIDDISACNVARYTDIFKVERVEDDEEKLWETVKKSVDIALNDFLAMRVREGERLKKDILSISDYIEKAVSEIEERSPKVVDEYRAKIESRIREFLADSSIDENRLLTEVAIFADKLNTNEEIVRLKSHIKELDKILLSDNPVGRRLDFLIQEMNREINTIGSKANDLYISKRVVIVKAEIEKMREQIQNIE